MLAATYAPPTVVLLLLLALATVTDVPAAVLVRDPAATAELSPVAGVASNVGVLLWAAGATVCLFTVVVLRRVSEQAELRRFLVGLGCSRPCWRSTTTS